MPRDHVQLISDVSELTGIFHDALDLEGFLQRIVHMISDHMRSQVCSIYLYYEEKDELVLKATKGLHADSVGKVRMKPGEGLTGLAMKELRPIRERQASRNPQFKFFPGIGEEKYESFLAVPIIRGQTRIGVMVVQNAQKNYFKDEDVKVLRAITSQVASTIETAKLLMSLNERPGAKKEAFDRQALKLIKGRVGSEGFALAPAAVIGKKEADFTEPFKNFDRTYSLADFQQALEITEKQLEDLQKKIEEQLSDVASLIFSAQILMLKDKGFIEPIAQHIKDGMNPPNAIRAVVNDYVYKFNEIANPYLREKKQDVKDIGQRLLNNLSDAGEQTGRYQGHIIIAEELFPSDILKLSTQNIKGVILLSGGASSHLSILARSLSVPLVIVDTPQLLQLPEGTRILMDAEVGNVYVDPSAEIIKTFEKRNEHRKSLEPLGRSLPPETKTKDKTKVTLLANINLLSDLKLANAFHAEGVGLYRTEFPFVIRSTFPSEEEQYMIYKKLIEGMPEKEITFRTLDIGGDKVLSYYNFEKEQNPFLGMRSIRFSLRHKDIFEQQVRAILRAGANSDIRIMFPMISSADEFLEARDVVIRCIHQLGKEGLPHQAKPKIGVMIELPAVLEIIDELARLADFFCIGSNDFIQYMLAVDRTNEKVADFYLAHHPAVLRALYKIVRAAKKFRKDVSICGDMAHQEKYIPYLLGIGICRFSIDTQYFPRIKNFIPTIDLRAVKKRVKKIIAASTIAETKKDFPE